MIGESMYYLEDEKTDFIMGDPLETDAFYMRADEEKEEAKGKDSARKKDRGEGTSDEEVAEAQADEVVGEEAPAEEAPVEEVEVKDEVPSEEEVSTEKASDEDVTEEVAEEISKGEKSSKKPDMDPEETAYLAQQTRVYQVTYHDMRKDLPKFRSGDKVSVGYRVIEGERSRIQHFDGVVIKISAGHGMDKTFTVRKVSSGIGVERIFPFHSPNIESIEVLKHGKVRRAKLYYLRSRVGKATRIKEHTS